MELTIAPGLEKDDKGQSMELTIATIAPGLVKVAKDNQWN